MFCVLLLSSLCQLLIAVGRLRIVYEPVFVIRVYNSKSEQFNNKLVYIGIISDRVDNVGFVI